MKKILLIANKLGNTQAASQFVSEIVKKEDRVHIVSFSHLDEDDIQFDQPSDYEAAKALILSSREKELSALTALFDCNVSSEVVWSEKIAQWAVDYAQSEQVDIVVKDGNRSESLFYKPTDWRLIRMLDCQLLLVSHTPVKTKGVLLASIDLGEKSASGLAFNERILDESKYLAGALNYDLHIGFAAGVNRALLELDMVDEQAHIDKVTKKVTPLIEQYSAKYGVDQSHFHIVNKSPSKGVSSLASELKASLTVMGTNARDGFSGRIIGNTAEKILHKINRNVLIIKK